ncbi:hypothetical protein [uncultured Methanomethylovorans sp.]|uniref:hypothetical protein n=1 Tax=uncultured Methanomethylovorans sp. TaxID=183759 RepID=UPI002AA84570|nr:hypothetical protein [uncultured Methanomethylovorans sp.]
MPIIKVQFGECDCIAEKLKYNNGRIAIQLIDDCDGAPVATATINIPAESLAKDEAIIKDYAENEGMVQALMDAGIITKFVRQARSGYITAPIYKVNVGLFE